jgi:hypothetical protein
VTYRRPSWQTLTLAAAIALVASAALAFSNPVEMRVNGKALHSDVPPVTTAQSKVFVPLRALADAIGAHTSIDKAGEISIVRGDRAVQLKVGDKSAEFNGERITLSAAPFRVRGRVMLGIGSFERAFGVRATYDRKTARIDVSTSGKPTAATPTNPQ